MFRHTQPIVRRAVCGGRGWPRAGQNVGAMPFDVDVFVEDCALALAGADRVPALREVLARASRETGAIADALGEPDRGGLRVLHHDDDLTVLNVVWTPGMTMRPHDHTMLAGIVVYGGREDNAFFRRRGAAIEPAGGRALAEGELLLLGDDAVHSVHSHEDRYTGGVHVYAGDFFNRVRSMWHEDGQLDDNPPEIAEVFERAEQEWRGRSSVC